MSNPLFRQLLSVKSPVHRLALLLTLEQARNLPPSWAWHEAFSMQCLSLGHLPAGLDVPPSDPCSDATLSVRPFLYVLVRMPLSLGGLSCSSLFGCHCLWEAFPVRPCSDATLSGRPFLFVLIKTRALLPLVPALFFSKALSPLKIPCMLIIYLLS